MNQLLLFVLRLPPTVPLGKKFQTMANLGILCNQRLEQVGRARLEKAAQCLAVGGTYDKAKGGVYELIFGDKNTAMQVRHVLGNVAPVPQHKPISRELMLMNWCSNEACVAEFGPSRRALPRFFPQTSVANAPFDKKQVTTLKNAVMQQAQTPAGADAVDEANRSYEAEVKFEETEHVRSEAASARAEDALDKYRQTNKAEAASGLGSARPRGALSAAMRAPLHDAELRRPNAAVELGVQGFLTEVARCRSPGPRSVCHPRAFLF